MMKHKISDEKKIGTIMWTILGQKKASAVRASKYGTLKTYCEHAVFWIKRMFYGNEIIGSVSRLHSIQSTY